MIDRCPLVSRVASQKPWPPIRVATGPLIAIEATHTGGAAEADLEYSITCEHVSDI